MAREKTALIVEGGAMRGIFSTGILDAFIKEGFNPFDMYIGVSAGAVNLAAYLANMYQRNYKVYTDYSLRPEFINWKKYIKGSHLVDVDWLWEITMKEMRLDLDKIVNRESEYLVGVTEVATGAPKYIKPKIDNVETVIKASSALPIFYRHFVEIEGTAYVDGGLADPIPAKEAYRRGATTLMVLRSRPRSYQMAPYKHKAMFHLYFRQHPKLKQAMLNRYKVYAKTIEFLRNPPEGIKIIEINPPENFKTKRLTKDLNILEQDYRSGYEIGCQIVQQYGKIMA